MITGMTRCLKSRLRRRHSRPLKKGCASLRDANCIGKNRYHKDRSRILQQADRRRRAHLVNSGLVLAAFLGVGRAVQARHVLDAFVVNTLDGSVSVVNPHDMQETRRFSVGKRPHGIAVSSEYGTVIVGVEGESKLKFFNSTSFELMSAVSVDGMAQCGVVLTPDEKHVLIAHPPGGDLIGIAVETRKEAFRIEGVGAAGYVRYGSSKASVYATTRLSPGIAVVDPVAQKLLRRIPLNVCPIAVACAPDESRVYLTSPWVDGILDLDAGWARITRLIPLPPPPEKASPVEAAYSSLTVLDGGLVVAASEERSLVDVVDVATGKPRDRVASLIRPAWVERVVSPVGPPTPGRSALLISTGDHTVQRVEIGADGKLILGAKAKVGTGPRCIAFRFGH